MYIMYRYYNYAKLGYNLNNCKKRLQEDLVYDAGINECKS